jgi:16S rRNA G966 N2-methylase RsmD
MQEHEQEDPGELMLRAARYPDIPMREVSAQIQARKKARKKLPGWYHLGKIIFPLALSVEQASSEQTARFKADLLNGQHLVDLTGGMGVDTFYLGQSFAQIDYVEQQKKLVTLATHNFRQLGASNIALHQSDALSFLNTMTRKVDCVYLDPARRNEQGRKVFQLQDCSPDVVALQSQLLAKAHQVLIKTAPLLDIQSAVLALDHVSRIWVVSVKNECKEVLYLLESMHKKEPLISTVNLLDSGAQHFNFTRTEEAVAKAKYSEPLSYLYEPNASVLKAGAFHKIAVSYDLAKLHANSHLYTSEHVRPDFPGRIFKLLAQAKYNRKALKSVVPDGKANICVRNFPESVHQIRKKTGINDGGEVYIFATTCIPQQRSMLICERITV